MGAQASSLLTSPASTFVSLDRAAAFNHFPFCAGPALPLFMSLPGHSAKRWQERDSFSMHRKDESDQIGPDRRLKHLTLFRGPFILQGTSSAGMEPGANLSHWVLASAASVSSS